MTQPIELIVVDLDGTLLNEKGQLPERNIKAVKAAVEKGVKVVIATGKTRRSADAIREQLGLNTPGIYLQGLTIYQPDGRISYQKTLEPEVARQVITFAEERGFDMIAYSGERILARRLHPKAEELSTRYHEPMPEAVGALQNILYDTPVNKLMAIKAGEPKRVTALRWQLDKQLDGKGRLMQAMIPDMLEILPPGGSKGTALKALIKELGIVAERVLAIGDGENDIEMIQLAGIGVAVGNADERLKAAANHIVTTNDEGGVGEAIERFVLGQSSAEPAGEKAPQPEGVAASSEGKKE